MASYIYLVKFFFILDNKGSRVVAKYYDDSEFDTTVKQKAFEKRVFDKTAKVNGEISILDSFTIVYRTYSNVTIYMVADNEQNEVALLNVLNTYTDTLHTILDSNINKRNLLEGVNFTLLALDEILDDGIVLESDSTIISDRVGIKIDGGDDLDSLDQSLGQVMASAREQLVNFLK
ncbi:longin domain-containing protein [Cavenderia fasciculata]|uniref:Zeta-coat protein n=1 Tax=Cavenderia fasciculata TaxID=261658 RepID=F4QF12_CACFS|nr:longin domain-containing protein [Cavenderia fasciculata]EGG13371.1 longin domain-containing protein [Cavenderia fasciculata]|eukprot:XP_004350075.1 longin domain-containing protein [Cavenderia fasciculata]